MLTGLLKNYFLLNPGISPQNPENNLTTSDSYQSVTQCPISKGGENVSEYLQETGHH